MSAGNAEFKKRENEKVGGGEKGKLPKTPLSSRNGEQDQGSFLQRTPIRGGKLGKDVGG